MKQRDKAVSGHQAIRGQNPHQSIQEASETCSQALLLARNARIMADEMQEDFTPAEYAAQARAGEEAVASCILNLNSAASQLRMGV